MVPIHDGRLGWSTAMGRHVEGIVGSDGLVDHVTVLDSGWQRSWLLAAAYTMVH